MKFLFISTHPDRPSYRFRIEQFLPYFRGKGNVCDTFFLPKNSFRKFQEIRNLPQYDAIFLQQKLLSFLEMKFLRRKTDCLIFDIDDAVMFNSKGKTAYRRYSRFRQTVQKANHVICGNEYLAEQTKPYNNSISIIPTAVDAELIHHASLSGSQSASQEKSQGKITIGWTGSKSNTGYLNDIFPIIAGFGERVHFKIISDSVERLDFDRLSPVTHEHVKWSPEVEFTELSSFDIGLMPLPDSKWTRGKCSFKALQYMALGIPTVCSPVGMNCKVIQHGINGFLPDSPEQWKANLESLIESVDLRKNVGAAGKETILKSYDIQIVAPMVVDTVEQQAQFKHPQNHLPVKAA